MSTGDWLHLKPYGYAPGDYMGKCLTCGTKWDRQDKLAWTCRKCAEQMHAAQGTERRPAPAAPRLGAEGASEQHQQLEIGIFDWLCRKYVQRADARQKSLCLQYMEAETHDLAEEIAKNVAQWADMHLREGSSPEGRASEGPSGEAVEPGGEAARPEETRHEESTQASAPKPKPLDDPHLQQVFGWAIEGALASGYQNTNPPPDGHWLEYWWQKGRTAALQEADGEVGDAEIGKRWRTDSSLEKWFPLTAERLKALEAEVAAFRQASAPQVVEPTEEAYWRGINEGLRMAAETAEVEERMKSPPCVECGAMTEDEAGEKCRCAGDKDDCHGCRLWPDTDSQASAPSVQVSYQIARDAILNERGPLEGAGLDGDQINAVLGILDDAFENASAPSVQVVPTPTFDRLSDAQRDQVAVAVAEALGDALDCTRVWSAWSHGTMRDADFVSVNGDPERVAEIAAAAVNALAQAPAQPAAPNPWRDAVDRELVDAGLDCLGPDEAPHTALKRLIEWEVTTALDPAVSEQAQALIEQGRAQPTAGPTQPVEPIAGQRITLALAHHGCDRLREWAAIGPTQRAAVELFADLIAAQPAAEPGAPSVGFSPMHLAPIDGTRVLLYMPTTDDGFAVGQWHGDAWGDDEGNYFVHEPVGWMGLHVLRRLATPTSPSDAQEQQP